MKTIFTITLTLTFFVCYGQNKIDVYYNTNSPSLTYGIEKLNEYCAISVRSIVEDPITSTSPKIFILTPNSIQNEGYTNVLSENISDIKNDGYRILKKKQNIYIIGQTDRGCLYGIMDIIEQLTFSNDLSQLKERRVNPAISFRAIKFNLPWSPYRPGPANDVHLKTCRDLAFWEAYLDMMVKNKFNALSLWNTHPFPYMIRAKNYPDATPFNDSELREWQSFWKTLFKMAKTRGIETYLVNWNIVVSPEFAKAYGAKEYFDRSELVKKYTRESVTQLINEYDDLTGLGVTLADWMGNWGDVKMTPTERENWIEETFVAGMNEADRKTKFIHRAVLAGDPTAMRKIIDHADLPEKTIVEVKFNWSHGHSTPKLSLTHANDHGNIMREFWNPKPENFFIAWMVRNEDFFVLRWGNPKFIKDHIKTNNHEYVDGYFVGSEGYIPAKDYSHVEEHYHKTWKYAFEKQWLFYHLWGRLLYDPNETGEQLAAEFNKRYKNVNAVDLLNAHALSSTVPLQIASFYKATWDFTLYSEGFMSVAPIGFDDKKSPFISIEELIKHETLDPRYLSIHDYTDMINNGIIEMDENLINPLALAQNVEDNCKKALSIVNKLHSSNNEPALSSELNDIETWCHLGFYFAEKLRAGVSLQMYNLKEQEKDKQMALKSSEKCLVHWQNVVDLTIERYKQMPYVSMGNNPKWWKPMTSFHWSNFLKDVEADIIYIRNVEKGN